MLSPIKECFKKLFSYFLVYKNTNKITDIIHINQKHDGLNMTYFVNANSKHTVIMHVAPHLSFFITDIPVSAE